jgi:hypothetical protein
MPLQGPDMRGIRILRGGLSVRNEMRPLDVLEMWGIKLPR